MYNQNTFYEDAGRIISEKLDTYKIELWALIGLYEKYHNVHIDKTLLKDAAARMKKLADELEELSDEID